MKMNLKFQEFQLDDVVDGLQARFKAAVNATAEAAKNEAQIMAAARLKVGLKKWMDGFRFHKVSDDFFVISIEGKLANWMEDGIQPGEVSQSIMSGNRIESNGGKPYVDVPIAKDADQMGNISLGKKGGPVVNVKAFSSADKLVKFMASDWKKGGIKQQEAMSSRVKDIIKNTNTKTGQQSFLTIRRVTSESQWPKTAFAGAKVLDDLGSQIEKHWGDILVRLI